jgi:hypothetical protein
VSPPASPTAAEPKSLYRSARKREEDMKARILIGLVTVASVLSSVAAGFADGR